MLLFSFSIHTIDNLGQEKKLCILVPSEFVPVSPEASIYTTKSGLEIWVPNNGEKCDDCPLPCTQHPMSNIRLIKHGNIKSGFVKITP